jgi:PAS domain S-box-containing protein
VTLDPAVPAPLLSRASASDREGDGGSHSWSDAEVDRDHVIHDEVIHQSVDAIIVTDRAFKVRVWNPSAERLYGVSAAEAIGHHVSALIEAYEVDGQRIDVAAATQTLDRDGIWRQRVVQRPRVGTRVGDPVTIDSIVTLLHDPDGTPDRVLAVNRDMTVRARIDSEMTALGSIVLATGDARTKTDVAETALDILCRAVGADAGLITSTDGAYEAIGVVGASAGTVDVILTFGQTGGPLAQALQQPDAFISVDIATGPLQEEVRAAILADDIRHLVLVGLRLQGRLIGVLALGWRLADPKLPSRSIVLQAAAVITSSLENARLLAAVESGLSQERLLTRRMGALVELTRLPDADAAGQTAVEALLADLDTAIGADGTSLCLVVGDRLELAAVHRIDPAWATPLMNRPLSTIPLAARLAGGAHSLLTPLDPAHVSSGAAEATAAKGYRTLAAFAIREREHLVGILLAVFHKPAEELEIDERTLDAIGRVLDISFANRRLREGAQASENRYRELFESSPDALLVQTVDEVVVDANPAAIRLYGGDVIGRSVSELIAEDVAPPGRDMPGPLAFTQFVGLGRRLDGSTFPEEVDLRPIEIAGEPRVLVIVRDLTDRRRMQSELMQAQKMEAIGMLVAGVAHELNNPLASIVAFSQLLRTDPNLPEDLRRQADLLVQEANRTRVIVQNLLDFARQRPPERVMTELRPLVDGVLGLQSYILAHNNLRVEIDIPDDLPRLSIDRSQMQQLLVNLTVNAAQAIAGLGRPGLIRIEGRAAESEAGPVVRIAIADDGPGVADEVRDRLFVPFVTTKEPGAGTGLGLSVSFGIVAGHGGTLRHEPNPGGGAVFVIELPVGRPRTDDAGLVDGTSEPAARVTPPTDPPQIPPSVAVPVPSATPPASPTPTPAPTRAAGPAPHTGPDGEAGPAMRVLVLDDESSIREFLGRVLARSGYEPILASTGPAALEIVASDPPDAILCDHRMAGMSGTEFHTAVAAINPALSHRFAFMSGDVLNPELLDFATERGVQLLAKPFDIATVGTMVSRLLAVER